MPIATVEIPPNIIRASTPPSVDINQPTNIVEYQSDNTPRIGPKIISNMPQLMNFFPSSASTFFIL